MLICCPALIGNPVGSCRFVGLALTPMPECSPQKLDMQANKVWISLVEIIVNMEHQITNVHDYQSTGEDTAIWQETHVKRNLL